MRRGVLSMKRLWQAGFGDDMDKLDYQYNVTFSPPGKHDSLIADTYIPAPNPEPEQEYWCILDDLPTW